MEKIEELKVYQYLYYEYQELYNSLYNVRAVSYNSVGVPMQHNAQDNKTDKLHKLQKISDRMEHIRHSIDNLKDYRERLILTYVYIEFKTLQEIESILDFKLSYGSLKRIKKKGIENIRL